MMRNSLTSQFVALIVVLFLLGCSEASKPVENTESASSSQPKALSPYVITIPDTDVKIAMVPVPHPDGAFWMSATEITWDAFDEFVFEDLNRPEVYAAMQKVDAVARPSKPYIPPDRGYGHEGFPAISIRHQSAVNFCRWMAKKTKTAMRLPREDEWEFAARGGLDGSFGFPKAESKEHAWFYPHALRRPVDPDEDLDFHDRATQPVGELKANGYGLYDMQGNVGEWVDGRDGKAVLKGGSWLKETIDELAIENREAWQAPWQNTDPQLPKSSWWLSDGDFAGFRIIRTQGGGDR